MLQGHGSTALYQQVKVLGLLRTESPVYVLVYMEGEIVRRKSGTINEFYNPTRRSMSIVF